MHLDSLAVVAHQGGWDEILLIAVPILLIGGALRVAKRRVDAASTGTPPDPSSAATNPDDRGGNGDDSLVE